MLSGMASWNQFITPWRCGSIFKSVISEHLLWIQFMRTSLKIALRWIPQDSRDDKLTLVNSSSPRQNGRRLADVFKCIFFNENFWVSIKISLKFVPEGPIDNK